MKLIFFIVSVFLCSCTAARDVATIGVTHHMDFSGWVPAIDLLCAAGIAAAFAALIWVPIQRWIPMAGITFFGSLIVTAHTVAWLVQWMPYLIAGGMLTGALWTIWHFRSLITTIRQNWNTPDTSPDPALITKIIAGK
jgi:hypothetical protein